MSKSFIAGWFALALVCGNADAGPVSIEEFRKGLTAEEKARSKVVAERLIELDPYLTITDAIFRLDSEPYVVLAFELSRAGQVSKVTLVATNLDETQHARFIADCMKSLSRAKFRKVDSPKTQPALLILTFRDPFTDRTKEQAA